MPAYVCFGSVCRWMLADPSIRRRCISANREQIDWDRYVDEDEEEENPGFDMSQLEGGMVRACGVV